MSVPANIAVHAASMPPWMPWIWTRNLAAVCMTTGRSCRLQARRSLSN